MLDFYQRMAAQASLNLFCEFCLPQPLPCEQDSHCAVQRPLLNSLRPAMQGLATHQGMQQHRLNTVHLLVPMLLAPSPSSEKLKTSGSVVARLKNALLACMDRDLLWVSWHLHSKGAWTYTAAGFALTWTATSESAAAELGQCAVAHTAGSCQAG